MADVNALLEMIQSLGIIIAAFYYITTIHNTNRSQQLTLKTQQISLETRQAQLFMELYKTCTSYDFLTQQNELLYTYEWDTYDEYLAKYSPEKNPEVANKIFSVMNFFEGLGVLLEQELINIDLVYKLLHPLPSWIWEKMFPIVHERRVSSDTPEIYEWFEYLVSELSRFESEVNSDKARKRMVRGWASDKSEDKTMEI